MNLQQLDKELIIYNDVFKEKKIIFLGENGHGVSEIQKLKIKMVEYLHEQFGFNKIVFEGGMGEIAIANHNKHQLSTKVQLRLPSLIVCVVTNILHKGSMSCLSLGVAFHITIRH
ncbi:hypothetical protein [Shouchella clausii]|uniref:hypothetical protein n=2 Tax=Shouchella clausii TaxID=79880 RepID=UPI001C738BEE|nr:hypothetical protein [Shouchella clausii]MBX0320853.1 hypothetical protein [Shouchella clausii]MDO7284478.1 hypothetical protein [Shouchella clausii]MDO7304573.1 hypothetical protein [Shouchella clausii]